MATEAGRGNQDALRELFEVAHPLLTSLANKFSSYHPRFEFEDFYSIGQAALYEACKSYNPANPSFLDYAKVFIQRAAWREVTYWTQDKRDVFRNMEVLAENPFKDPLLFETSEPSIEIDMGMVMFTKDLRSEFESILGEFEEERARILRMYVIDGFKVSEIAKATDTDYKRTYHIVTHGIPCIQKAYRERHPSLTNSFDL